MKKLDLRPRVKRTLASAAASATILAFSVTALATNFSIEFYTSNPRIVELSIESLDAKTGDFSGEAMDEEANEIWEINGTIMGNKVELEFNNLKDNSRIIATGQVSKDGTIAGNAANDSGELFEWEAEGAFVKTS